MKILKIELQNINSLKSDTPILIDFENDQFKDVGLYAITGSTGAGKTTILDSITIALYHNVPRFNGTKGSLINVISYGAYEALSRVTFENENTTYEAFWSIRIADKKGKLYATPKEEVSLKNLTTGAILANQKRNLITEVTKIAKLDYNQFLRSVMLAQGEFASFLTAKGPDKGKLLEQITGEQIYKKIGQGILERKSLEEKNLAAIQAQINADDVLNEDAKAELTKKDKTLDDTILKIEKEFKTTQLIVDWYKKEKELLEGSKKLEEDSKQITAYVEKSKTELALLALHEKAIPFKEQVQAFNRTEKNKNEKTHQLKLIDESLVLLTPKIKGLENEVQKETTESELANNLFNEWLPKFDVITQLDSKLKTEADNQQKTTLNLEEITANIQKYKEEEKGILDTLEKNNTKIKKAQLYVTEHSFLKEVDLEISSWTQDLTVLKANKKSLQEDTDIVLLKQKDLEKTSELLKKESKLLGEKNQEIEKVEKEYTTVSEQLAKNNLNDLLTQKETLTQKEANWKQFKNLSTQTINAEKEHSSLSEKKKGFVKELESAQEELKQVQKEYILQEKAVTDASKILDLEKSIAKYEDDRQHLSKGIPCGLCGSKEHPFTDDMQVIDVSKSESELNSRKEKLKTIANTKVEWDKKEASLQTNITNVKTQIQTVSEELVGFKNEANTLPMVCELTDISKITAELKSIDEQIKILDLSIKNTQQLQISKNELSETIETQKTAINSLKTTAATHNDRIKNIETDITSIHKTIDQLTKNCTDLENDLTIKLAKFKYTLPTVLNTDVFIQDIENSITTYNNSQQFLNTLTAENTLFNNNLANTKKQLDTCLKSEKELLKNIETSITLHTELKTERAHILPLEVTVEAKRTQLQATKDKLIEKLKIRKKELQKQLDVKTEKDTLKITNTNELKKLTTELHALKTVLDKDINNSEFENKQAIEKALLDKDILQNYTNKKESINRNQLQLKALTDENLKEIDTLKSVKKFEISQVESKLALEQLNIKKEEALTEKGKIAEAFRKDEEIRNRNKTIYEKIDIQGAVCATWRDLFKIIGNSKDAFNVYVQRLTLKHLLDLANVHLYKLNKRYSLKMEDGYKPKEELNFNLIDHYQTDQVRLVDTSSGGEKFIISLALALGLSDLSSKNVKIDSLFIDEGFGTLDKNTLEIVISTLENLQSQGKMIGIISHVENLKERISSQIKITKKSNGVSVVDII